MFYYTSQGQRLGPVRSRELKQLAAEGKLLPTDMVQEVGLDAVVPAGKIRGLYPLPG
jgi:hypothetical protein